ncbi:MAG: thioesterase family protein [Pirellulaceae bacterium]|nr:thioesterase family protein [Pirellulaceae bacterium]
MKEVPHSITMDGYPIVVQLPIQWGDLDAYGHVNSLVHLKWFESARAIYASAVGVDVLPSPKGIGGILASIQCHYVRQASYPGDILTGVRAARVSVASITLEFQVTDAKLGVPLANGSCDAILYDYATESPIPIPDPIRAAVEQLEGRSFPP